MLTQSIIHKYLILVWGIMIPSLLLGMEQKSPSNHNRAVRRDYGRKLIQAAKVGDLETVCKILALVHPKTHEPLVPADFNDENGNTPLIHAIVTWDVVTTETQREIIALLLASGANSFHKNHSGFNAINFASNYPHLQDLFEAKNLQSHVQSTSIDDPLLTSRLTKIISTPPPTSPTDGIASFEDHAPENTILSTQLGVSIPPHNHTEYRQKNGICSIS